MSWIEWTEETFRGLNLWKLKVDHAYLNVTSKIPHKVFLYSLSEECEKCPFTKLQGIQNAKENILKIDTFKSMDLKIFTKDVGKYAFDNDTALCHMANTNMGQFGVYDLIVTPDKCDFLVAKEPVNIYLSLLVNLFILIGFYGLLKLFFFVWEKFNKQPEITENPTESSNNSPEVSKTKKARMKSLDVFRGISIILMIFVNYGGGHYWFIEHATWNGLHIADVVFPWFLFLMGACIPMSVKSQLYRNIAKREISRKIIKRSIILFLIGLFLNTMNGATFDNVRIFGVLQRFGISYLVVSLVHLYLHSPIVIAENQIQKIFLDMKVIYKQWIVMLVILFLHLINLFAYPVPGCESGYFGPGGKHDYLKHEHCTGGSTGYWDRLILGEGHVYQWAKIRTVYEALVFDPEGVIGSATSIIHTFLGLQCGMTILTYPTFKERVQRWFCWAIVLGLLAGILCKFSKNDGWIPVNKNLWSLSFVFATVSLAYLILIICYYLVDVKSIWTGAPFLYPGMNSIVLYIGHTIFHKMWPFRWSTSYMNTHFIITLENLYATMVWIFVAYKLYKKNKFYNI